MADLTHDTGNMYYCKACGEKFITSEDVTPVCCPVCRMNRIKLRK